MLLLTILGLSRHTVAHAVDYNLHGRCVDATHIVHNTRRTHLLMLFNADSADSDFRSDSSDGANDEETLDEEPGAHVDELDDVERAVRHVTLGRL